MKKLIMTLLLALALMIPCFAQDADLVYDYSVIDFDHACDYYNVSSNKDIASLAKPIITSRVTLKGSVLSDGWEIQKTKNTTKTTETYKTVCTPYTITYKNLSKEEYKNCTQIVDKKITETIPVKYWSSDFLSKTTKNKDVVQIRYCANFKRNLTNEGAKLEIDNIPTFYGKTYTEYVLWNSSWNKYLNITFNSYQNITQENFPAWIVLDTTQLISNGEMSSNCSDIRIIRKSDIVQLSSEVANNTCNTSRTLIHYKDNISVGVNEYFLFYSNNDSVSIDGKDTFSEYSTIAHTSDYSDILSGLAITLDSAPTIVNTGKLSTAWSFDGTQNFLSENFSSPGETPFSLSLWFYATDTDCDEHYFFQSTSTGSAYQLNGMYCGDIYSGIRDDVASTPWFDTGITGTDIRNKWVYYAIVTNKSNSNYLNIDGVVYRNTTNNLTAMTFDAGSRISSNGVGNRFFKGKISELRISNKYHDNSWFEAERIGNYTIVYPASNNTDNIINPENLSLLAARFDRFNVSISNQSYVLVGNYTYNTPINSTQILVGSGYASKISGAGTTNLNLKILVNNVNVYNDTLVSFSTNGEYRTFFLPKIINNVTNTSLTSLQIYFNVSNAAIVNITNFGIGLMFNATGTNQSIIEYTLNPIVSSYNSSTYTNIGSQNTTSDTPKNRYISFSGKINSSASALDILYIQNNQTSVSSPLFARYLSSSADIGIIGGSTIQNRTTNQSFNLYANTTNGVTSTYNGNIFTLSLNTSIGGIQSKSTSNNMTNFNNGIIINATYYKIVNTTIIPRSNITNGLMIEFIGNFYKSGGTPSQNPIADVVCNMSNGSSFIDQKYVLRTTTDNNPYCNPKIIMFGTNFNKLTGNTINIDCYVRNTGNGTLTLLDEVLNVIELTTFNLTYVNVPPTVTIIEPQGGTNQSENFSLNWSITNIENYSVNVTLTNSSGWIQNIDNMTQENTSYIIDTGLYNFGAWSLGVYGCDIAGCGVDSIIVNFVPTTTTTTTTTTTSSSTSSTTTTLPNPGNSSEPNILYIYAIMIPCFAVLFTLSIIYPNKEELILILKPLLATTFWIASSFWTTNILFIENFTIIGSPYYVALGNQSVGGLFLTAGIITGFYSFLVILIIAYEQISKKDKK